MDGKSLKKSKIERLKYSSKRQKSLKKVSEELILPNIAKKDPSNVVEQLKEKYKKKNKRKIDSTLDGDILNDISVRLPKRDTVDGSPPRINNISIGRSESRSHSIDQHSK